MITDRVAYAREFYWLEREAVIRANEGRHHVSMICVLPDTPQRPWGDVSAAIAAFPSSLRFLAHFFVDAACPGPVRPHGIQRVTFDGILGSAGTTIDLGRYFQPSAYGRSRRPWFVPQ